MEWNLRCRCGERYKSSSNIQTCRKCKAKIYPVPEWLTPEDRTFQEQRSNRKVRKLDFEVR